MRKMTQVVLGAVVALAGLPATGALAHGGCSDTQTTSHKHTASGSCKDPADRYNIHCGSTGRITTVSGIGFYANPTADGAEVESCNDSGGPNEQGRLLGQVSASNGARIILDSDPDQPFPAGFIIVQLSPNRPGVWCGKKDVAGDGYARPWSNPGDRGGLGPDAVNCLPGN